MIAAPRRFEQRGAHGRRGGDIEAAAQREDRKPVGRVNVQLEIFVMAVVADDDLPFRATGERCWGGWTRTNACQDQNLVPYQLGYAPKVALPVGQRDYLDDAPSVPAKDANGCRTTGPRAAK